jgi:hypothetical protein
MKRGKQPARQRRRAKATTKPRRPLPVRDRDAGTTRKMAVSMEKGLAAEIEAAAAREKDGNVSAWLADSARETLRLRAMDVAIAAHEAEHGPITPAELAEADRLWPTG